MNRWDEAIRVGLDWLAAAPNSADAHAHQAWAFLRRKTRDLDAAEQHARSAIGLAPDWNWPLRLLAHTLGARGRWDEALALTAEALSISPDDDEAHVLMARCLCNLGRSTEALPHAQQAVALNPDDADHRRFLHWLEYLDKSTAADIYNRLQKLRVALALDPTNVNILRDLAMIHASDLEDFEAAGEYLRQATEIAPDEPAVHEAREDLQACRDPIYRSLALAQNIVAGLRETLWKMEANEAADLIATAIIVGLVVFCILPIAIVTYVPFKVYSWLLFAEFIAGRTQNTWLARWLWRVSRVPLLLRQALWLPLPLGLVGLIAWLLPVPPLLTVGYLGCGAMLCLAFSVRSSMRASNNRRMLVDVVTADSADEIVLAEPADDIIRAELA
jgi:tetratricopeptide (TPR) repeat protein